MLAAFGRAGGGTINFDVVCFMTVWDSGELIQNL